MATIRTSPSRWTRLAAIVLAALVQLVGLLALLNGFAPVLPLNRPLDALVSIDFPDLRPAMPLDDRSPDAHRLRSGPARAAVAEGIAAPMAVPRATVAPPRPIVLAAAPAPPVAAEGLADRAGAALAGSGSGAGGAGSGIGGGGRGGAGQGGGGASGPVKLSGEISSARDYPAATRELRLGDHVILALSIDPAGMVDGCRIVRPSRDVEADAITCRLARERFRFRPARDAGGRPVRSTFGWQQRWFRPGTG